MRIDHVGTIVRREYLSRVQSKGFWVATLILPLALVALVLLPSLILMKAKTTHRLTVVDGLGDVGPRLTRALAQAGEDQSASGDVSQKLQSRPQDEPTQFEVTTVPEAADPARQAAQLDAEVLADKIDSWIRVTPRNLETSRVEYHAASVSNFITQRHLKDALHEVFSAERLEKQGYDPKKVVRLTRDVGLDTLKVTETGTRAEAGGAGVVLAYVLFLLLYVAVSIYGQMVMNGVLEEKASRIVEVLLATTTPGELMLGKLLGIALAGLTQLGVWMVTLAAVTAPAVAGALAFGLGDKIPQLAPMVFIHFLLCFVLGFLLFAAMYAAIGAATNSAQEAQQFFPLVLPFLFAPIVFALPVINDPDSTLAVVLSLIPPFTPLLMLLRVTVKMPPIWQILLGYALTTAFVAGMVWLCARIYRVGILMYGKRPTFKELGRWILRS